MITLKHDCSACGTPFSIHYNEMFVEGDPTYCPFCGEYLILEQEDFDEEDDDEPL